MRRLSRPLLYVGIVGIVFGLAKLHAASVADPPYDFTGSFRFGWTIAYAVLLSLASYGAGLPELARSRRHAIAMALAAPATAALGVSVVELVVGDALLPRFVVLGSAVLVVPWELLCIALAQGGRLRAELRDRVLLVSERSEALVLDDELQRAPERPAVVVGHLEPADAVPAGERSRPIVEQVLERGANLVVVDRAALAEARIVSQAAVLHENGIRVRTLSLFYEEWLGKLPMSELERVSLLFDIREVHGARYGRVKRLVDLAVGLVGVVVLCVVVPFVAIGNLAGNRGRLLYRQERVGKNGRLFTILKFRTMVDDPTAQGAWTVEDDPRITTFGRFLRRTHLDELPQVVNMVRGELSLVGPRPEQPRYVAELVEKLSFYDMRHLVRPGLTGWAQVKYGYAGDDRGALEKLQYEFWYLRHQGFALDARIVGRTVRSILGGEGSGR